MNHSRHLIMIEDTFVFAGRLRKSYMEGSMDKSREDRGFCGLG